MKIAIVHDELFRRGGAEQVVLCFAKAFPQAPIYTMVYNPKATYPEFRNCIVYTSWFQKIAVSERVMKWLFFPFGLMAMKQVDVTGYDVVLMSSTYSAKFVKVRKDALIINYCHSPFRLAWYPESYAEFLNSFGIKKWLFKKVINVLRKIDFKAAQRADYFIANSKEMAEKIKQAYSPRHNVTVINPPAALKNFSLSQVIENYFLVVCRLEYYKRVDIVVEAFNRLKLPLIVVGTGSQEAKLKQMAGPTIVFKKGLSNEDLAGLYSKCRALIFPQHEDYGITPLEANASGRPVIAYGKGGVLETMVPYNGTNNSFTSIFFNDQTVDSLIKGINSFEQIATKVQPGLIRKHAEKFDESEFVKKMIAYVNERIQA